MAHHVQVGASVGSAQMLLGQTLYNENDDGVQGVRSSHRKENNVAHFIRTCRIVRGPASFNNRSNASKNSRIRSRHSFSLFVSPLLRYVRSYGNNLFQPSQPRSRWIAFGSYVLLTVYWLIIASVSIYDMHLTVKYAGTLKSLEQNPVGRWLMQLDAIQHDVIPDTTLFLSFKSLGTVAVLLILAILIQQRARLGHPVAIGVSMFQLSLAWYLRYGEIPDNWFLR